MTAFGIHTTGATPVNFLIAGRRLPVLLSPPASHFAEISVLGGDFHNIAEAALLVDYQTKQAAITLRV